MPQTDPKVLSFLLQEMLNTWKSTRAFCEYKLKYLVPDCPNSNKQIDEFQDTKNRADLRIKEINDCLTWLSSLETSKN